MQLLNELRERGSQLAQDAEFAFQGIPQEQIVNLAYKTLVFNAFQPAQ